MRTLGPPQRDLMAVWVQSQMKVTFKS